MEVTDEFEFLVDNLMGLPSKQSILNFHLQYEGQFYLNMTRQINSDCFAVLFLVSID